MAAKATLVPGVIDKPVAMRGVHTGNRVKDRVKAHFFKPLLFSSLLEWANENGISVERKKLLWDRLYKFYGNSVYGQQISRIRKKLRMFFFLIKSGIDNPYLLRHYNYQTSFSRLLK